MTNKIDDLQKFTSIDEGTTLTTNQGVPIHDNQNSLKNGERGSTLLEDFILREKITHFDHERIPERIVHARGEAAHGYFQVYESMAKYTKADFLQNPAEKTPVFVRFSTVAGSRGSADTVRDVRGFAVKFYTNEGNYDLVGNNMPVFFIQDAIKFPDLIHAVKPEPHNEIPQAASAHDTFWDFVSLTPESMHMIMWAMSDRAIPRSLRMMEGFGVHTFRFINDQNQSYFVKFHWKPVLGTHSLVWDEAQKLAGKDADFHRRDLWEAIESGAFPEWELGVQLIAEEDEHKFDFDLLDPTKLIPEELIPVKLIGKLTLNRNPDNFFAETEQAAFHPGHVVSGIDFTNDPLLQGRLFSYTDTQISRLGGANFHEIPINRPLCPFHNNQRDGMHRHIINKGQAAYEPNSLAKGYPKEDKSKGFVSYNERVDAHKVRARSPSFSDHFSQAKLFWNSQTPIEQEHIVSAFQFELSKLETPAIRERILGHLAKIDKNLTAKVANHLGLDKNLPSENEEAKNMSTSTALSMIKNFKSSLKTRKVAVIAINGILPDTKITALKEELIIAGAMVKVISDKLGFLDSQSKIKIDGTFTNMPSINFDAVIVLNGKELLNNGEAVHFILESYKHLKTILLDDTLITELQARGIQIKNNASGVILSNDASLNKSFMTAVLKHRHWDRSNVEIIPA
jgi:catalase